MHLFGLLPSPFHQGHFGTARAILPGHAAEQPRPTRSPTLPYLDQGGGTRVGNGRGLGVVPVKVGSRIVQVEGVFGATWVVELGWVGFWAARDRRPILTRCGVDSDVLRLLCVQILVTRLPGLDYLMGSCGLAIRKGGPMPWRVASTTSCAIAAEGPGSQSLSLIVGPQVPYTDPTTPGRCMGQVPHLST